MHVSRLRPPKEGVETDMMDLRSYHGQPSPFLRTMPALIDSLTCNLAPGRFEA